MIHPPKYLCKKNTIEKVAILYKALANTFYYYKQDLDKLKDKIEQIDLSEHLYIDNFLNTYDTYLSDLANNIGNLLLTRKDTMGDDGELVIRPVDRKNKDFTTEIWYSHVEKNVNGLEKVYPSRIICKYDNFSLIPLKEGNKMNGYLILIGDSHQTLKTSSEMLNDIIQEETDCKEKIKCLLKYFNNVLFNVCHLHDYCLSNSKIVNDYLLNFKRIHNC